MGYSSGAPHWVNKQNEALLRSSHHSEVTRLNSRIEQLEKENNALRQRIKELEEELSSTKG